MLTEDQVYGVLRECYDPEIPVNIVDLGLVYAIALSGDSVIVQMTLTSPGCHMGSMIANDVEDRLLALPECREANVELVWDPPWNPQMMSDEAKKKLDID